MDAIDTGNMVHLELLLERLDQGYFANPYLLWFVADNPIRVDILPQNITAITRPNLYPDNTQEI